MSDLRDYPSHSRPRPKSNNGHENYKGYPRNQPLNPHGGYVYQEQFGARYSGYLPRHPGYGNGNTANRFSSDFRNGHAPPPGHQLQTALEAGNLKTILSLLQKHRKEKQFSIPQSHLDNCLLEACTRGMKFVVQDLVRSGANVREKKHNKNWTTPLHVAASQGFVDIADFLLTKGADVNSLDHEGNTPLLLAVNKVGSCDMLNLLLSYSAELDLRDKQGTTALMKAVEVLDIDAVRILMAAGANVKQKNKQGKTAADIAVSLNIGDVFSSLQVEAEKSDLPSSESYSALNNAVKMNQVDCLQVLLDSRILRLDSKSQQHLYQKGNDNARNATLKELVKSICAASEKGKKLEDAKLEMVKILLKSGAVPDKGNARCSSALVDAVRSGSQELVELISRHVATNPNFMHNDRSALMIAAENGNIDTVNFLLSKKSHSDPKIANKRGETALTCALLAGQIECAQVLIKHSKPCNRDLQLILRKALERGQLESLHFLASHCRVHEISQSLMKAAIETGDTKIVHFLIDHGADVTAPCDGTKPPLLVALRDVGDEKRFDMVKFLVEEGANVNRTPPLDSPLVAAVENNCDSSVLRFLMEHGADVNEVGIDDGTTPLTAALSLHFAMGKTRHSDMLEVLLEAGADPNKPKRKGITALHLAVSEGIPGMVKQLIDRDAYLEARNSDGLTPLLLAANQGQPEVITQLKRCGANMRAVDIKGRNALIRLLEYNTFPQEESIRLLAYDIDQVNLQANDGLTPLMQAAASANLRALEILLELGADLNVVDNTIKEQTALGILLEMFPRRVRPSVVPCVEKLVHQGALYSLPHHSYHALFYFIMSDQRKFVQLIVTNGMAPLCIDVLSTDGPFAISPLHGINTLVGYNLSPLAAALVRNCVTVARYLAGNWFLTKADVVGSIELNNLRFTLEVEDTGTTDSLSFLNEYLSQPMSLVQLCFIAVSSQVGAMTDGVTREEKVRQLPLPTILQDKLLFKREAYPMNFSAQDGPVNTRYLISSSERDDNDSVSSDYSDYNFYGSDIDFEHDQEDSDYLDNYLF